MFSREIVRVCQSLKLSFCSHRALPELLVLRSYSTVSIGKHFEKAAVLALTRLSFDVSVCGGPKDRGVDFRGKWRLKGSSFPVVGQCRKYKKRLGPRHVREMEGVLGRESDGTLGILVSAQGYTKDAYDTCMGSSYSLALSVLQGSIDSDLELGSIEAGTVKRAYTLSGNAIKGLDATDEDTTFNRDCFVPAKCAGGLQEPSNFQESLSRRNDGSENFGEYFPENQMWQTQCNSEHKIAFDNDSSNARTPATCALISSETEQDICVTNPLVHDTVRGCTDKDDWNKSFATCGQITLFELNPAARKLLPHVFLGITYKGKHTRIPEIMFVEDDSILHVKTE